MYNIVPHKPEEGTYGDCHRNCIAMLLGVDQLEVPHFFADGGNDGTEGNRRIEEFLADRGYSQGSVVYSGHSTSIDQIFDISQRMMKNIPLIFSGESSKGCNHSIVILNGEIFCDPSGSGIIGPCLSDDEDDKYYWLTFISPSANVGEL